VEVYGAISLSKLYQAMFTRLKPTSKYFGVEWRNGWCAYVCQYGKRRLLGRFDSEISAALAVNEWLILVYGDAANLNKVE